MTEDANERVQEIFAGAFGLEPELRDRYVDETCSVDEVLRSQVRSLLAAFHDAGEAGFMDRPTDGGDRFDTATTVTAQASGSGRIGIAIGPYHLLEKIGEGEFGTVYMAEQREPIRRRPLKNKALRSQGLVQAERGGFEPPLRVTP